MLKHVIDIGWTSVWLSVCPSVRPSVRLSHASTVSKRPNLLSWFLHHTIARSFSFCVYQDLREIPTVSTPAGPLNRGGMWKYRNFRPITCHISETVEDRWVLAARRLTSIEFSFDPCNIYRDCPRGVHRGNQNVQKCAKMGNFQTPGLNYWETVEDRWIYAARRFTSSECSFQLCDTYRDCPRGHYVRGRKMQGGRKKLRFPTNISL